MRRGWDFHRESQPLSLYGDSGDLTTEITEDTERTQRGRREDAERTQSFAQERNNWTCWIWANPAHVFPGPLCVLCDPLRPLR